MGAFSSLLAGFGQGAGEHIAQINESKRQEQVQNQRLGAKAKFDYLTNNEDLSPLDKTTLLRSGMKDLGVKDQDIAALEEHLKSMGLHPMQQKPQGGDQGTQGQPQTNSQGVVGAVPTPGTPAPQGTAQSSGTSVAGPMPQAPNSLPGLDVQSLRAKYGEFSEPAPDISTTSPREVKDYYTRRNKFYADKEGAIGKAVAEDEGARANSARDIAKQQGQVQQLKQVQDQFNKNSPGQRNLVEWGPSGPHIRVDKGTWAPGYVSTEELIGEQDANGQQISDPSAVYRRKDFGNGDKEYTKIEGATRGAAVQDPNSSTGWSYPILNKGGQQVGLATGAMPRPGLVGTQTQSSSTPNLSGGTDTSTKRTPVFGGAGVGGAIPKQGGRVTKPTPGAPAPQASSGKPTMDDVKRLADMIEKDDNNMKLVTGNKGLQREVSLELGRRGQGLTKIDPAVRDAAMRANAILSHTSEIENRINDLDKKGQLGTFVSRLNDFEAGKVGAGDPDFEKLRVDTSMLKSGAGLIHYGGRAGVQSAERFDKLLDAGKMDAPTLIAGVAELNGWLTTYKNMLPKQAGVSGNVPPPNTVSYNDNGTVFDIPLDKVTAFENKHPTAKKGQ